jgi:hypothetical protein
LDCSTALFRKITTLIITASLSRRHDTYWSQRIDTKKEIHCFTFSPPWYLLKSANWYEKRNCFQRSRCNVWGQTRGITNFTCQHVTSEYIQATSMS